MHHTSSLALIERRGRGEHEPRGSHWQPLQQERSHLLQYRLAMIVWIILAQLVLLLLELFFMLPTRLWVLLR